MACGGPEVGPVELSYRFVQFVTEFGGLGERERQARPCASRAARAELDQHHLCVGCKRRWRTTQTSAMRGLPRSTDHAWSALPARRSWPWSIRRTPHVIDELRGAAPLPAAEEVAKARREIDQRGQGLALQQAVG